MRLDRVHAQRQPWLALGLSGAKVDRAANCQVRRQPIDADGRRRRKLWACQFVPHCEIVLFSLFRMVLLELHHRCRASKVALASAHDLICREGPFRPRRFQELFAVLAQPAVRVHQEKHEHQLSVHGPACFWRKHQRAYHPPHAPLPWFETPLRGSQSFFPTSRLTRWSRQHCPTVFNAISSRSWAMCIKNTITAAISKASRVV